MLILRYEKGAVTTGMVKKLASNGVTVITGKRRFFGANRSYLVVIIIVIALGIGIAATAHAIYRALNPAVVTTQNPGILAGIDPDDIDYESMPADVRSAQLERQIGVSLTELKTVSIQESTFDSFDDAYRAALALRASGDHQKALQAFAVAESQGVASTSHAFYYEYANLLASYKATQAQARQMYQKALETVKSNKDINQASRDELTQRIEFAMATMSTSGAQ